ncbi:toll-like receptor 7 [Mercenaria mercenaria]|uniref:toll-like receptor 7 n=1 Tax=Mercenaria mercenaria TaxID=6596 RepID=UPI00234F81D6|nr:toll-like receptor 7 [Mercenaria mercenaria]
MRHILHNFLFLAVLKFITGKNGEFVTSLMDDCSLEETSVICEHSLPQVLPDNVSSVIVKDFLHVRIKNETFTHKSWMTIYFLDITVNLHVKFYLYDYNFSSLKNLKTLGIHSPELTNSDQNHILYGLMKLMSLNLSSCYYLNAAAILNMLETHEESVDTLILDQLAASKDRYLVLDGAFFKLVSKLKIRKLSLSGCNLLFSGSFQITNLSFYLNDFDISNTTLIDISNTSLSTILLKTVLSHLKSLDLSLIKSRFFDIDYGALDKKRLIPICDGSIDNYIGSLFLKVEHLKLNGILSRSVRINNSFFNLSTCISNLKSLQLRSNKLHFLNSTIVWPDTVQLYELDLSSNDLEYLSPFAFGTILSLEVFLLAHNKLYRMSSYMEFQNLLFPFKHLWHLDMSHNQLNKLPFDFFSHNINLTILDLSHNELSSINFKIRHLINLRFLNMEHNKILFIEGSDVSNLALLIETMPKPVEISFAHNPLLCICKSKEFITWLSSYIQVNKKYNYVCT